MHGELIDTHKEFFIGINQEVSASGGSLWHDLYFIRASMIPNFFSKDLAQQILVIGKSFNFLRACIHSNGWQKGSLISSTEKMSISDSTQDVDNKPVAKASKVEKFDQSTNVTVLNDEELRRVESTLRTLRYGDEVKLEEIVGEVSVLTDERLLRVMMEKAHLMTHLHALKKFMLLGQVVLPATEVVFHA